MNECDYSGIGKCWEADVLLDYPISKIKVNSAIEWADLTILMLEGNNNNIQSNVDKYPAILPDQGSTVVIDGTGSLKAQGGNNAAGIGAGGQGTNAWETLTAGYIKISGGIIEAFGGYAGTGIGGRYYSNCQGIEISGGYVTAKAGTGFTIPAIGYLPAGNRKCEYVTLERCTINAYSKYSNQTDPVVTNSVMPDVNDSDALANAEVILNEYETN